MDKKSYRKSIKAIRNSLDSQKKAELDAKFKEDFFALPEIKEGKNFFMYLNFGSEINTVPIIEELLAQGKNVYIPWIDQEKNIMLLTRLKDLDKELMTGFYGIQEIKEEYKSLYDGDVDVVLTPGLVFDKNFYRIGYGGGFYDKYFSSIDYSPFKIALAYSFQVVDQLPVEEYDQQYDALLTEKGLSRR